MLRMLASQPRVISSTSRLFGASSAIFERHLFGHKTIENDARAEGSAVDLHEVELARGVCRGCVVREPCRAYADVQGVGAGVWGGSDIEGDRASGAAVIANLLHPSNLATTAPAAPGRG